MVGTAYQSKLYMLLEYDVNCVEIYTVSNTEVHTVYLIK